jgi:hypothetical protein
MMHLYGMPSFTKLKMVIKFTDTGSPMTLKSSSIMIMIKNTALLSSQKTLLLSKLQINLEAVLMLLMVGSSLK